MSLPVVPCGHIYSASMYRKQIQQQPYQDYWSHDPTPMYAASRNKNASYLTFTALCALSFNHTYRKSERSHRRIIGGVLACLRMHWQFYACCILCDVNRLTIRSCLRQGTRSFRVARVALCGITLKRHRLTTKRSHRAAISGGGLVQKESATVGAGYPSFCASVACAS